MSRKEIEGSELDIIITSIPVIGPLMKEILVSGAGMGLRLPSTVGRGKLSWTDQPAEELHNPAKLRFPTRHVRVEV